MVIKSIFDRSIFADEADSLFLDSTDRCLSTKLVGSVLLLNVPPSALFDRDFVAMFTSALRAAAADDSVRALIFAAAPERYSPVGSFSSVDASHPPALPEWVDAVFQLFLTVICLPKATVSMLSGEVGGMQLALSLSCDCRVGSMDARLDMPAPTEQLLTKLVRLMLSFTTASVPGEELLVHPMEADEALRIGLLHKVVGSNGMLEEALRSALTIRDAASSQRRSALPEQLKERLEQVLKPLRDSSVS